MQLLLVDGFGVLHPRRCGSASQLGVLAGLPTGGGGGRVGAGSWELAARSAAPACLPLTCPPSDNPLTCDQPAYTLFIQWDSQSPC